MTDANVENVEDENEDKVPGNTETDDEDDCEGYFLEPVGETVNVAEKIAKANKELFEEELEPNEAEKPRKVQFSEDLVNFEPDTDNESLGSTIDQSLLDDKQLTLIAEEPYEEEKSNHTEEKEEVVETALEMKRSVEDDLPFSLDQSKSDEIIEEIIEDMTKSKKEGEEVEDDDDDDDDDDFLLSRRDDDNPKLLLILLPQEQSSSCESIIGEDIVEDEAPKKEDEIKDGAAGDAGKIAKSKIVRPKSACSKKSCEMTKISPNLNYSSNFERRSWQGSKAPGRRLLKSKGEETKAEKKNAQGNTIISNGSKELLKKINIDTSVIANFSTGGKLRRCDERPKSSFNDREKPLIKNRPKTAPIKRTCCVFKSELPRYNGLRSEYGLSAEQLQERKQMTIQMRRQRKQDKLKERQDELRKKMENEEIFQRWLMEKKKKGTGKKAGKTTDTLARSDVYIQTHASYASNKNVPYSINYNLKKKLNIQAKDKTAKKIVLEKLFEKMSPHHKKSFNIYLGMT